MSATDAAASLLVGPGGIPELAVDLGLPLGLDPDWADLVPNGIPSLAVTDTQS